MDSITVMVIRDRKTAARQFSVPKLFFTLLLFVMCLLGGGLGFFVLDYCQLLEIRQQHLKTVAENQHLRGEAQLLVSNLENVKKSLQRVQDYTNKLSDFVHLKVDGISQRTGVSTEGGEGGVDKDDQTSTDVSTVRDHLTIPLGIGMNHLIFRSALDHMSALEHTSQLQAIKLQKLLATLMQKKSLLSSIPSVAPVRGWVTSAFGFRTSPVSGKRLMHNGIDIAAAAGTPIYAPADGVVVYAGEKDGFGNFIMIAHFGSGVVTSYGHNAENMVRTGQTVKRGDRIGSVGNKGRSTGPHLHYEVYVNGRVSNPKKFILNTDMNAFAL